MAQHLEPNMNKITGRIIHKETGEGIPNLCVELCDVDPDSFNPDYDDIYITPGRSLREENFKPPPVDVDDEYGEKDKPQGLPVDRLGSVFTDVDGHFELHYHDDAFKVRKRVSDIAGSAAAIKDEVRPDLFIFATTAEDSETTDFSNVIYRSNRVRVNAGRIEHFLIQITTEELHRAGIFSAIDIVVDDTDNPLPPIIEPEKITFKQQLQDSLVKKNQQKQDIRYAYKSFITVERLKKKEKKEKFIKPFCDSISKVDATVRNSRTYVQDGESVKEKTQLNIKESIIDFYNNVETSDRKPNKGIVQLTDEQFQAIAGDHAGEEPIEISGADAEAFELITKGSKETEGGSTDLILSPALDQWCKDRAGHGKELDDIFKPKDDTDDPTDPVDAPDGGIIPADAERDVPYYIANQMNKVAAPEDLVMFGANVEDFQTREQAKEEDIKRRASQKDIEDSIDDLSFKQGPADTPAFYDFHQVHIAFEHVWQEVFDQGTIDVAEQLYDKIVDSGGEPVSSEFKLENFYEEAKLVATFTQQASQVPVNVQKVFQINADIWNTLSETMKTDLEENANEIVAIDTAIAKLDNVISLKPDDGKILRYSDENEFDRVWGIIAAANNDPKLNNITTYGRPMTPYGQGANKIYPIKLYAHSAQVQKDRLLKERSEFIKASNSYIIHGKDEVKENEHFDAIPKVKDLNAHEILQNLNKRLKDPYSFKIFAANEKERSVNFGVLVTYRQRWDPQTYQAGELVKTIPLAPKETIKYTKKEVRKKKRTEKEIENSLRIRKEDSSDTGRAESEIMAKANNTSNFKMNASGEYDSTTYKAKAGMEQESNSGKDSSDLKKSFRESVVKAAQEYKNERKLEISTEESYESEYTESGEITNPNEEITVTYLFYELQRRYKVWEHLHRLRSVVFVAQEVPKPNEIDEDWILAHKWILQRVMLSDQFDSALHYIDTSLTGKEVALEQRRGNLVLQKNIVDKLQSQVVILKNETTNRYRLFEAATDQEIGIHGLVDEESTSAIGYTDPTGTVDRVNNFLFGDDDDDSAEEAARMRREAALAAYDKAAKDRDALLSRLSNEVSSLNVITERYIQEVTEYLNIKTQIESLKVHIKQNILHYMQAIWSYEPTDQRYFRLFQTPVPVIDGKINYKLNPAKLASREPLIKSPFASGSNTSAPTPPKSTYEFELVPDFDTSIKYTTLEQVADLDTMLGYKGNYMIFPMKKSNKLTDYMMAPYLDNVLGLRDPDEFGEWNLGDYAKYVRCLKANLPEEVFTPMIPDLEEIYKRLLKDPLRQGEEIIVPTGSLFIEALPGTHPILEDFKLIHRAIDVKKVQAEVRDMELENIRAAARILEGDLSDPDVDKKIVVEGSGVQPIINLENE